MEAECCLEALIETIATCVSESGIRETGNQDRDLKKVFNLYYFAQKYFWLPVYLIFLNDFENQFLKESRPIGSGQGREDSICK